MSVLSEDALRKKWSFLLRICSVNVNKSPRNYRYGHIYWINPEWKLHFLCSDNLNDLQVKNQKPLGLCWDWIILISNKNWKNLNTSWKLLKIFEKTTYLDELFHFCSNFLVTEILNTRLNPCIIVFMKFLFEKTPAYCKRMSHGNKTIKFTEFSKK